MKRLFAIMSLLMVASMVLAACAPAATPTEAPPQATEAPTAAPTEAPTEAPTAVPTEPPTTRKGGWLDEIAFSVITSDSAVTQLAADAIDIYAGGLAAADFPSIKDAGLAYSTSNGLYYDQLYNAAACTDTTKLNPFTDRKIREATNWLYDRNYINQEVYAGGALPKWFVIQTNGPDYADLADVARGLEAKYAYNPDQAKEVITAQMEALGATMGSDGKWQFNGAPVVLAHLIRTDSDGTRVPIGDYVSAQLESVGFTVDRQYKTSREAGPIWQGGEPELCEWQIYTAAWSSTQIDRDERDMFQQMYLPSSVQGIPVWLSNEGDPTFRQIGDDLATGNYTTLEQRREMMAEALPLSLEDSFQVWLIDGKNFTPYQTDVQVSSDLAAGVEGANIYPFTLRFIGQEGGVMRWAEPDLFGQAWNPVAGSNWAFDQAAIRATQSGFNGHMPDPYTGIYWPLRYESGEVTVLDSLPPVNETLGTVTLNTAAEIPVPADAWVDWDAATQTFIPAGEGTTAKLKSVVTYPADFFETVKWHDGSNISVADFVMAFIEVFDRAKPESAIYDEAAVPFYESYYAPGSPFKGVKIVSTDPLVVEYYTDTVEPDAENNVQPWWPSQQFGESSWPVLAIGNRAEAAGEMAWSTDKSAALTIEETSFVGGPTLELLAAQLDEAAAAGEIPYEPTMSAYLTADEVATRYANLKAFYEAHNNFWVGTGPYYLDQAFLTEKTLSLKHFDDYPDMADRWSAFGEPKLAEASLDGPGQVPIGEEAAFDLTVNDPNGDPYPAAEIKQVKFLVYNETGETVYVGEGVSTGTDGAYTLTIPADITGALTAGTGKIEAAVIVYPVAVPSFAALDYVVVP